MVDIIKKDNEISEWTAEVGDLKKVWEMSSELVYFETILKKKKKIIKENKIIDKARNLKNQWIL